MHCSALERSGIGASPLAPVEVITPAAEAKSTAAALAQVDGVRAASAPDWAADGRAVTEVFTAADTNSNEGRSAVDGIVDAASTIPQTAVGGQTALINDWVDSVYGSFPLMLGLISLITFVLLARAFRSIVLPLKAIVMNLLSVFATWGVMTLVWQEGFGTEALFNAEPTGSVAFWAPMIVFAFIYGLSMDYEVFILARMREEYDRTGSTDAAVIKGIGSTGPAGDERRADRVPGVRVDGHGTGDRREDARDRARRRRPARRPGRALAAGAGDRLLARALELVDARTGATHAAPAPGGGRLACVNPLKPFVDLATKPVETVQHALNRPMSRPTPDGIVSFLRGPRDLRPAVRDKVVLITGASSGIGEAAALAIGAARGTVVLVARTPEKLEATAEQVRAAGGTAYVHPCDLSDLEAIDAMVADVLDQHGRVDILVNNAGRSIRRSLELSYDRFHDYERTMQLNYFAPVRLMLGLLPGMRERGFGQVINISSIGVQTRVPRFAAYIASKAALDTLSRRLAGGDRRPGRALHDDPHAARAHRR